MNFAMYFKDSGLNTDNESQKDSKDSQPTTCLLLNQLNNGEMGRYTYWYILSKE